MLASFLILKYLGIPEINPNWFADKVFDFSLIRIFVSIFINKMQFFTKELLINFCGTISDYIV